MDALAIAGLALGATVEVANGSTVTRDEDGKYQVDGRQCEGAANAAALLAGLEWCTLHGAHELFNDGDIFTCPACHGGGS